jgi:MoaA/NifB/PqqE/SkfB family radical SAM enzyme
MRANEQCSSEPDRAGKKPLIRRFGRRVALSLPFLRPLQKAKERHAAEAERLTFELEKAAEELSAVRSGRDTIARDRDALAWKMSSRVAVTLPASHSYEALVDIIKSGGELDCADVRDKSSAVEAFLAQSPADKLGIHREIGKAIFARSVDLYCGKGLPASLTRFTYPGCLAILLNTHCNAACFFCREADYKGTWVEAPEVLKLDTAIRNARVVDLTGWGEPFLYPHFKWVVQHILDINPSPRLIQVTTNGSLLSEGWGKLLSGKINRIVVSLNAATLETYANQMRYKNNQFTFGRIMSNLRAFLTMLTDDDRERIALHMVANADNFRDMPRFIEVAAELGIPEVSIGHYISAQKQYVHKTLWNLKQEYNDAVACAEERAEKLDVRLVGRRRFFTEEARIMGATNCMAPFESMFIEPKGTTAPCCFMGNERMGNVYQDGFEAVWFSDIMNNLRKSRSLSPCKVCAVFNPFDEETTHISATLLTKSTTSARDERVTESAVAGDGG